MSVYPERTAELVREIGRGLGRWIRNGAPTTAPQLNAVRAGMGELHSILTNHAINPDAAAFIVELVLAVVAGAVSKEPS